MIEAAGVTLAGRFQVEGRQLGTGSFGRIVLGVDTQTNQEIAVKLEPADAKVPQLLHESKVLKRIGAQEGFPALLWAGSLSSPPCNAMVLTLLGPSLEDLLDFCTRKLTAKSLCLLAVQLIRRLQAMHRAGFLHRDIKPENFLVGLGTDSSIVYSIDFGLAKPYINFKSGEHVAARPDAKRDLVGTARYASLRAHEGKDLSRRDDVESLAYMLTYLGKGSLPWQGIKAASLKERIDKIGSIKTETMAEQLCEGLPPPILSMLRHARSLDFVQKPNYDMMVSEFQAYAAQQRFHFDGVFDWTVLSSRGKLQIQVCEARNLTGKGRSGLSDAFVVCKLENGAGRVETTVVNGSLNPSWNDKHEIDVSDPAAALVCTIWHKTSIGRNRFLGRVRVPLSTLQHRVTHDDWFVLEKRSVKSHVSGDIRLKLQYNQSPLQPHSS